VQCADIIRAYDMTENSPFCESESPDIASMTEPEHSELIPDINESPINEISSPAECQVFKDSSFDGPSPVISNYLQDVS